MRTTFVAAALLLGLALPGAAQDEEMEPDEAVEHEDEEGRADPAAVEAGLASPDVDARREAAGLAGGLSPDAVEALLRLLAARVADAKEDDQVRAGCALALAVLGPRGEPAVPALLAALRGGEEVRRAASEALGVVAGAGAVEPLVALLREDDVGVRTAAAATLGRLGAAAAPAREPLAALLDDLSAEARLVAARALIQIGGLGAEHAPRLRERLESDPQPNGRRHWIELLLSLRPVTKEALDAVTAALRGDRDPWVRRIAAMALGALGPDAAPAAPDLARAVGMAQVGEDALRALSAIGPAGASEEVVKAVSAALAAADHVELHGAWDVLARLGPAAAPELAALLASPHRSVRRQAAEALARGGPSPEAAKAVEAALAKEPFRDVRGPLRRARAAARGEPPPAVESFSPEEVDRLSSDGPGPTAAQLTLKVRPGGKAKLFELQVRSRHWLTEPHFRWEPLEAALKAAAALPDERRATAVERAWEDHMAPDADFFDLASLELAVKRALFEQPIELFEEHLGEPLFLGDLVQTDGYRGLETYLVAARVGPDGTQVRRLVDPYREEYYVSPPSYLTYPDVVPTLDFWDPYQVDQVPISPEVVRASWRDGRLVIGDRSWPVTAEERDLALDPRQGMTLYVPLETDDYVTLHAPAEVDRSPSLR